MNVVRLKWALLLGCLLSFLLVAGGFWVWVRNPPVEFSDRLNGLLSAASQDWQRQQKTYGTDTQTNLYLDPQLRSLWLDETQGTLAQRSRQEDGFVDNRADALNGPTAWKKRQLMTDEELERLQFNQQRFARNHSTGTTAEQSDSRRALSSWLYYSKLRESFDPGLVDNNLTFRKALLSVEKLIAPLQAGHKRKVWLKPADHLSVLSFRPDYVGFHQLAQGLELHIEYQRMIGQPSAALQGCQQLAGLGQMVLQGDKTLEGLLLATVTQNLVNFQLIRMLRSPKQLSLEELLAIQKLAAFELPTHALEQSVATELLMVHISSLSSQALPQMTDTSSLKGIPLGYHLLDWSGLIRRDLRLFDNEVMTRLQASTGFSDIDDLTGTLQDELDGKRSLLAAVPLRLAWKIERQNARMQAEHGGIKILAALELYRRKMGKYPDNLKKLAAVGLTELPVNALSSKPYVYSAYNNWPILVMPIDGPMSQLYLGTQERAGNRADVEGLRLLN